MLQNLNHSEKHASEPQPLSSEPQITVSKHASGKDYREVRQTYDTVAHDAGELSRAVGYGRKGAPVDACTLASGSRRLQVRMNLIIDIW